MVKYFILFFLFGLTESFSQIQKERVVIIFDALDDRFKDNIFTIDNQDFKFDSKSKKVYSKLTSVNRDICTINDLNIIVANILKSNKKNKSEFYYRDLFDINIFVLSKENYGILYPVEKVWLVETSIKD